MEKALPLGYSLGLPVGGLGTFFFSRLLVGLLGAGTRKAGSFCFALRILQHSHKPVYSEVGWAELSWASSSACESKAFSPYL